MKHSLRVILEDLGYFNPWEGCASVSDGCLNCPSYKTFSSFHLTDSTFNCRQKSVFICNHSELFSPLVDSHRHLVWNTIQNNDNNFLLVTKLPERIMQCLPEFWDSIKHKVSIAVSVERQQYLYRLDALKTIDCFSRYLFLCPLLEKVQLPDVTWLDSICISQEMGDNRRNFDREWYNVLLNTHRDIIFRGERGESYV